MWRYYFSRCLVWRWSGVCKTTQCHFPNCVTTYRESLVNVSSSSSISMNYHLTLWAKQPKLQQGSVEDVLHHSIINKSCANMMVHIWSWATDDPEIPVQNPQEFSVKVSLYRPGRSHFSINLPEKLPTDLKSTGLDAIRFGKKLKELKTLAKERIDTSPPPKKDWMLLLYVPNNYSGWIP